MTYKHLSILTYLILSVSCIPLYAKSEKNTITIPGIGSKAPSFEAQTTKGTLAFPQDYEGKWVVLFSHPADFTPVCETEFKRLARMVTDLEHSNVYFIGLSTDSVDMHDRWKGSLEKRMGKRRKINFPIIADTKHTISKKYGMIHPQTSKQEAIRAVYIIDPNDIIRAILFYPSTTGRNFHEIKRLVLALQESDKHDVFTPAEWQPGDKTITPPTPEAIAAIKKNASKESL